MYLQPLKEMMMYRKGLYATKCQLLAFRYKTHTVDTEWGNAVEGAAVDAAELIRTAQKRYLDLVEDGSDTFNALNKRKFLRALKEVSFLLFKPHHWIPLFHCVKRSTEVRSLISYLRIQ